MKTTWATVREEIRGLGMSAERYMLESICCTAGDRL